MHEIVYFNAGGRAEVTRIMLHAAGVEFKDTRLDHPEWQALKPSTPLGQLPLLKIDDKTYVQSAAQHRYAAKLAGFYPSDPVEALVCDEIIDSLNDMMGKFPWMVPEEEKKAKREEFQAGPMTTTFKLVEQRIQDAGGNGVVASGPCVADVVIMCLVKNTQSGMLDYIDTTFFDAYPGVSATTKAMEKHPKVKAYYDSLN